MSSSQSATTFSRYHLVMILAASVTTVIVVLIILGIFLIHPQPRDNQIPLSAAQPVIRTENYTIINIPRPEPCKDDPGVICYVPFQEKLPLPPNDRPPVLPPP